MKGDFFATSQNCFPFRTARKIAFRSATIFLGPSESLSLFLATSQNCFPLRTIFLGPSESLTLFLATSQNCFSLTALFFSVASQPRKIGCGSENKNMHSLFLFSLSFVFSRFESKLSSGFQLRIKNQLNLFLSSLAFHYFCTPIRRVSLFEGYSCSKGILFRRESLFEGLLE